MYPVTTVTLQALMRERDESIASIRAKPSALARLRHYLRAIDLRRTLRVPLLAVLTIAGFVSRHGLVIGGCCALVIGAATLSATAAWIMAAASLFFLEARRR